MSLLTTLYSFQTPLTLLLILFGPSLLPRIIQWINQRGRPPTSPPSPTRSPIPLSLKLFLGIHTLYLVKQLIRPPYDVFVSHNLPILVPNSILRSALLGPNHETEDGLSTLENPPIHPLLELLLTRLKMLDNRYLYARFGHDTIQNCVWCKDDLDYLIFSLPGIMGPYVVEGVMLGMLGWKWLAGEDSDRRAERWRIVMGWVLLGGVVGEIGSKWFWEIRAVEGDCLHLATTIHTLRSVLLLLLPLVYTFLPLPSPSSIPLPSTLIPVMSNTTSTLRLTSLARGAIASSPRLREIYLAISRREETKVERARRDEGVREAKKEAEVDEERMREGVRGWVKDGWDGMVRIDGNGS
ncbi:hypothetical protein CI109_106500 [Kwoniella shandongensis]|uniref:Uncharacterized protein n=1 Tax=Kwoniella shandongensis TaxID=1734106 RepID=A0A5M6C634_9TREE|nr:uncharacterized protein CI109_002682 [Kwoniella shandongensis]KAA5528925.1 hypothetical protein CI109_002682 [Kwoniella shandongensis]